MCAVGGEDGGGGGLSGLGGGEGVVAVGEGGAGEAVSCGDGVGGGDEEGGCFEEGYDEEEVIVGVELGGVDWGFEFGGADACLIREIPESCPAVLGGGEEVAATT